jgi:predicted metal-binding membrane protein
MMGGVILIAWIALAAVQQSAYAELFGHEAAGMVGAPPLMRLAAFLFGWLLMTAAMMLPASLPQLDHAVRPMLARTGSLRFAGLTILGYLAVWLAFGLLVYLGDTGLHRLSAVGRPLARYTGWIASVILLAAGLYQFSPGKRRALRRCQRLQTPSLTSAARWLSGPAAIKQGTQLGMECLGACWSLMLLMSALGHNRLDWMIVLSGMMIAERQAAWGQRLAWLAGLALIVAAGVSLLAVLPGGHSHHH